MSSAAEAGLTRTRLSVTGAEPVATHPEETA